MHDKDQLTADQVINVEPMEIKTFKIELQKQINTILDVEKGFQGILLNAIRDFSLLFMLNT